MNSRERVLTTFQFEEPDRVPCWLGASPEFRALMQSHLDLDDDESFSVWVADDFRRVFTRYVGPDKYHPTKELSYLDATYRTPFGVERHGYGYGMPLNRPLIDASTINEIHD